MEAHVIAEAILAAYYDADSSPESQIASDRLVDASLTLAAALVASRERIQKKDRALRFYAKEENFPYVENGEMQCNTPMIYDRGKRAKKALKA